MSDSKEIAAHKAGQVVTRETSGAVGIPLEQRMSMLREAMFSDQVDPAKAVALAELMFRLEDRDRQAEFNRDKIAAKAAMPAIFKRGFDEHKKKAYVLFEDIQRAIDPVLERFNLMLDFEVGNEGQMIAVTPVLRHHNGWVEKGGTLRGPVDAGPGRSAIQGVGSSVSYLKRYSTEAILNLVRDGEDNDGAIREDTLLNDRQQGVLANAQAAYDEDRYPGFYNGLNAKDRAMLINSGHHARFTGGRALPGAQASQQVEEQRQDAPRDDKPKMTPEQQVDAYVAAVRAFKDLDKMREYQTDPRRAKWIEGIKDKHPDLHQKIIAANSERASALMGGAASEPAKASTGNGLFGDEA